MKETLSKNRLGLTLGCLMALAHAILVAMVATRVAKPCMDFILSLHFINLPYEMDPFMPGRAALLLLVTFSVGYVGGWIFAAVWNKLIIKK